MKVELFVPSVLMTPELAKQASKILEKEILVRQAATFTFDFQLSACNASNLLCKLRLLEELMKAEKLTKSTLTIQQWKVLKRLRRNLEEYQDIMEDMRHL